MNSNGRSFPRFYALCLVVAAILIGTSGSAAFGQERSTDRDNPTPLTANVITDELDGSDTAYFYKFTAGPGKLTVTIEVKASGTNAGAMLDLFDAESRPILSDVLAQGVDGGSERIVNSVQLSGKRDLVMKIKGLKYGDTGGTGTYKITLDGPVSLTKAPAPQGDGAAPNNGAAAPANGGAAPAGGGGAAAPVASNLVSGQLDPADERVLFHTVNVNSPGQVTFSFSVKASDAKAGAKFTVLTEKNHALVALDLQPGESVSKPFTFDKAQTLLIMVVVNKIPGDVGRGSYSVQLDGPAEVGPAPGGSNSLSGQLERVSFHIVNVNARGQVTFTFSVKATDANAGANFAVVTMNGSPVLKVPEVHGGESFTKPLTLDKTQTLSILVYEIEPDENGGGQGTYSIQVSGPVTVIR